MNIGPRRMRSLLAQKCVAYSEGYRAGLSTAGAVQRRRKRPTHSAPNRHFSAPGSFTLSTPSGDDVQRRVCDTCGFVDYQNPKIICGSVPLSTTDGRILLVKRKISPRKGYWALPGGFMECRETVEAAAAREAREEANAIIRPSGLLAMYSLAHISQVHLIFSAALTNPESVSAGEESMDVGLFTWTEVPWDSLAFPTTSWALMHQLSALQGLTDGNPKGAPSQDFLVKGLPPYYNPQPPNNKQQQQQTRPLEKGQEEKAHGAPAPAPLDKRRASLSDTVAQETKSEERPKGLFWSPTNGLHLRQF